MAFNIICWAHNQQAEAVMSAALDDLPFELKVLEPSLYSEENITDLIKMNAKVIVNFLPDNYEALTEQYLNSTQLLATFADQNNIPFIQMSSYLVFGSNTYSDELNEQVQVIAGDERAISLQKLEAIFQPISKSLVIRTSWLLNACQRSVFAGLTPLVLYKDSIDAVSDHNFGNPIHLNFMVGCVIAVTRQVLCDADNWGVFHLCSADSCSEAELADQIVRLLNSDYGQNIDLPDVAAGSDARALFPVNANLQAQRITDCFGIQLPSWRKGFKVTFKHWLKQCEDLSYLLEENEKIVKCRQAMLDAKK